MDLALTVLVLFWYHRRTTSSDGDEDRSTRGSFTDHVGAIRRLARSLQAIIEADFVGVVLADGQNWRMKSRVQS